MSKPFLVTATRKGHFGQLRKPGDIFEVTEAQFAKTWMRKGAHKSDREPVDLKEIARAETLASGGANAALVTALADLKEANDTIAVLQAKVAELEVRVASQPDAAPDEVAEDEGEGEGKGDAPAEETPPDEPPKTAPVQRVRRTPQTA